VALRAAKNVESDGGTLDTVDMRSLFFAPALLLAMTFAVPAFAKQPPPGQPQPTGPSPSDKESSTKSAKDDPMLQPVPPAPHTLSSWQEALSFISARDVDLRTAAAEVDRARAIRRQALGAALPQIDATGSVTLQIIRGHTTTVDTTTGTTTVTPALPLWQEDASLSITQPILAPRVWYGIGTADKGIELAKLAVGDTRRKLITNVADAIVGVVSAEEVSEINRSELSAALRRLALTKHGVDLGAGANVDVVRFDQDVTSARQALVDGDEQLLQARERLGLALGSSEPFGVAPDIKLDDVESSAADTCKLGTLRDRPDISALYLKKEISLRHVTDVDLEYLPTAELSSTLTASSEPIVGDTGHVGWNVMAVITVPIWDGGVRYGERRAAKVDVTEAELDIESAERQGRVEISQAERGVDVAAKARDLAIKARDQARELKRLAESSFQGGTGTSFDVVDATNKLRQAELTVAGKELDVTRAKLAALLSKANCQ
jgi:outer membrane protein, multidrug efflux system